MKKNTTRIDLVKMAFYILKRAWLIVLCAAVGFAYMYWRAGQAKDTYTTSGTMYVYNESVSLNNYGYLSDSDISTAVKLVETYSVVVKSESVTRKVLECQVETDDGTGTVMLGQKYGGKLTPSYIGAVISMAPVNDTPVVRVSCTTDDRYKSRDICNAVLQVAPQAIQDVIGGSQAKMVDAANLPGGPNPRGETRRGMTGALIGAAAAAALLVGLSLFNAKVTDPKKLTENSAPPVPSAEKRRREESDGL